MPDDTPALVVVAAGGVGTRVCGWAQFIPKEFYPVAGQPGITRVLQEIAGLGPVRVVIVYHPYYEQFARWSRQVLTAGDHARYATAASLEVPRIVPSDMTVSLIPQHGPYGDLTSVLNGADHLHAGERLYVAFADNLYPGASPLPRLRHVSCGDVTVLASRYRPDMAGSRGVLITRRAGRQNTAQVTALVEKPDREQARALEEEHGAGSLLMLEGRAVLTQPFLDFARGWQQDAPVTEARLALALGAYARAHRVVAVRADCQVIDLGAPEASGQGPAADCAPARRAAGPASAPSAR